MNIDTKLEKDTVLFTKFENQRSKGTIIKVLKKLNINTVRDLIEFDQDKLYEKSKNIYIAMAYIFRNTYLGEKFPYDYILDKEYNFRDDLAACIRDLHKLGVIRDERNGYVYLNMCMANYDKETFTMDFVLRNYYSARKDLAKYYVEYMNKRNIEKQEQEIERIGIINLERIHTLEIEINTINQVLSDLDNAINTSSSSTISLINFRKQLEVELMHKRNQLSQLRGTSRTRR